MISKILYTRVSSLDQKTDRQRVTESDFDLVIEDKCSGAIPFFERDGGKKVKALLDKGIKFTISAWSIDRAGRDLRDILNTLHIFTEKGIQVEFISQSIKTLNEDGTENQISKLILSTLGVVSEMNRNQIRENQLQGISLAKLDKTKYQGRKKGSKEDTLRFLTKDKNKKALELLRKGYKGTEVSKIVGVHINTITKIRKMAMVES
jgi:DNA invertase Pin-like site-specific DNA recombinase